ncbi:uncharacterized protein [Battus philenor]|uniref:uncharacterized protein n=1 Tax=Battus philenor TaxID=42288 RepID=UPI0035CF6D75
MWSTIKKFGLSHCDLPTMLENVSFFLSVLTIDIMKGNNKRMPVIVHLLALFMFICYFYVYLFSVVWFVFVRCRETGDLIAAIVVFSLGIASEIGICKLIYMFIHMKSIKVLVEGYLRCDAKVTPGDRFHKNLLKSLRNVKRRALIYWTVIIGNGVAYIFRPIMMPGRHFMEDSHVIYGLEPKFETPYYEIAMTMTAAGICVCCYLPSNITAFFIVLGGYTESQMLALSEELSSLFDDAKTFCHEISNENHDAKQLMDEFIKNRLKDIILRHTENLNLLRKIDKVAMDCFNGQRLLNAGYAFEQAVYDCKWENFNNKNMRTVLLMLQTAQRPLSLSAGGVTVLSFSCLMSVLRSIYSAYTTLRTTMK